MRRGGAAVSAGPWLREMGADCNLMHAVAARRAVRNVVHSADLHRQPLWATRQRAPDGSLPRAVSTHLAGHHRAQQAGHGAGRHALSLGRAGCEAGAAGAQAALVSRAMHTGLQPLRLVWQNPPSPHS